MTAVEMSDAFLLNRKRLKNSVLPELCKTDFVRKIETVNIKLTSLSIKILLLLYYKVYSY